MSYMTTEICGRCLNSFEIMVDPMKPTYSMPICSKCENEDAKEKQKQADKDHRHHKLWQLRHGYAPINRRGKYNER